MVLKNYWVRNILLPTVPDIIALGSQENKFLFIHFGNTVENIATSWDGG